MSDPTRETKVVQRQKLNNISNWTLGRTKKHIDDSLDRFFGSKTPRPLNSPLYGKKKP